MSQTGRNSNAVRRAMQLYAVTDRAWTGEKTLYQQVQEALEGGITCLQLREKDLPEKEFMEEALQIRDLCARYHVPFIINDNVRLAVRCGADGVHVGQSDMPPAEVRQLTGDYMLIGVSAQTVEEAKEAEADGADYLGVGACFTTSTKKDAHSVSYDTLKEICAAVSIPVVAIGGIKESNILQLKGSGADGVAVVSAIFAAEDIRKAARNLRKLSEEMSGK